MKNILPNIEFNFENSLNLSHLFDDKIKEVWLEVGFGDGEHLKWQLENNKHIAIIGCEPYINGIANLLSLLNKEELKRVKIFNGDARKIISFLKEDSISKIFILFPDPWPKKKHYKRRFIQFDILNDLYRILTNNGELRISTDHYSYLSWVLFHFIKFKKFYWPALSKSDFLIKPENWNKTKYEIRAKRLGNICYYLQYFKQ
ncbi:MAG: tRNA (guanosine(46)-N7)-methyltransferase TrmB [Pelagibacterales bacterium]|nr:tRNA (guanosine(46)-N7)-methyltransferase TrmB [Pelagibacterales bacterium]